MPHSDVQDVVSAEDLGVLGGPPNPSSVPGGVSLQQAIDILLRAVKEAQCCEGILRSHVVNLEAELEAARREASDCSRMAEETKVENQQLKAKAESLGKLVAKQQQVIAEHEGRLRAFSAKTIGAMLARKHGGGAKRRRLADHEDSPKQGQDKVILRFSGFNLWDEVKEEETNRKGKSMDDKTPAGKAALAPFRSLPTPSKIPPGSQRPRELQKRQEFDLKDTNHKRSGFEGPESGGTRKVESKESKESKETDSKKTDAVQESQEETEGMSSDTLKVAQVAGLRIWEPRERSRRRFAQEDNPEIRSPEKSERSERSELQVVRQDQAPQIPSPVAFTRSGSFEHRVRAEGQSALTSSKVKEGVPCRCVVRGKAQRSALQGFDCEQCRRFYEATKLPGPKPDDLKASRHRSDHAPTCTPPGFWDLSFPQDARSSEAEGFMYGKKTFSASAQA